MTDVCLALDYTSANPRLDLDYSRDFSTDFPLDVDRCVSSKCTRVFISRNTPNLSVYGCTFFDLFEPSKAGCVLLKGAFYTRDII